MSNLPALLSQAFDLAATRRMAYTRRQNIDYRFGLVAELLQGIIRDLQPLPDADPDDSWQQIEDDMDEVFTATKDDTP